MSLAGLGVVAIWHDIAGKSAEEVAQDLASRPTHAGLAPDPRLPDDTRLWAALQQYGGGTWGGCVYDVDAIIAALERGNS